jgi:hypothetical protein
MSIISLEVLIHINLLPIGDGVYASSPIDTIQPSRHSTFIENADILAHLPYGEVESQSIWILIQEISDTRYIRRQEFRIYVSLDGIDKTTDHIFLCGLSSEGTALWKILTKPSLGHPSLIDTNHGLINHEVAGTPCQLPEAFQAGIKEMQVIWKGYVLNIQQTYGYSFQIEEMLAVGGAEFLTGLVLKIIGSHE